VSINIDELRRLHEAATPGEWAAFGRELCGPPKPGGRKGLCIFSTRAEDADSELCLYLRNHVPDILAALTDRERLDKLADDRIADGIYGIDIDEATLAAIPVDGCSEQEWTLEWRKQFRAAIDSDIKR
jgi:hypothetical protein